MGRRVSRRELRTERRRGREQVEATAVLKKVVASAGNLGHTLGEVGIVVGPRGGKGYVMACACGYQTPSKKSPFASYREGMGHLGDVLGKDQRQRISLVLDGRRTA